MKCKTYLSLLALLPCIGFSTVQAESITTILESETHRSNQAFRIAGFGDISPFSISATEVTIVNNNPFAVRTVIAIKSLLPPQQQTLPAFGESEGITADVVTIPANSSYRFIGGDLGTFVETGTVSPCSVDFVQFIDSGITQVALQNDSNIDSIDIDSCNNNQISLSITWQDETTIQNGNAAGFANIRQVTPLIAYSRSLYGMFRFPGDAINGFPITFSNSGDEDNEANHLFSRNSEMKRLGN